jgi:hypothetical protein
MTEPQPSYSPEDHPLRGRGRNLAIAGIVSGAVSFLVIPILFGPLASCSASSGSREANGGWAR